MSKSDIQELIDNFSYNEALQAYLPYCTSPSLKKLLEGSRNTFTTKKLKQGLRSLMDTALPEQHASVATAPAAAAPVATRDYKAEYAAAPSEVKKIISEQIDKRNEARLLKEKLSQLDPLECRDAVFKIRDLWDEVQELFEKEQYWRENGELPQEIEIDDSIVIDEDLGKRHRRYLTLRTYKKRANWPKYEAEFNALEKQLKKDGLI